MANSIFLQTGVSSVTSLANGSAGTPALAPSSDPTEGIYFGTNTVNVAVAATNVATFSVPSGASTTSNFLNITGTLPTVPSAAVRAVYFAITSAGSASQVQSAFRSDLLVGYTGSSQTNAGTFINAAAGTAAAAWTNTANNGVTGAAQATTAGHNVGTTGRALGSSTLNMGVLGSARDNTNTPALNIGIGGLALNGTLNVGAFFGLMATAPTLTTTCALIADNGAVVADIFQARNNGTRVAWIASAGGMNAPTFTPTTQQTYTITNVTPDRAYDANATSLDEVADTLGTLIADLRTIGLVL